MPGDAVLLVHGLWMNRVVMLYLARQLRERGFAARAVGYYSAMHDLARNARRLAGAIAELDAPRVHLVTHSMGGVVALAALRDRPDERVHRVIARFAARRLGERAGLAARRAGARRSSARRALWGDMPRLEIPAGVEAGAIAGARRVGLDGSSGSSAGAERRRRRGRGDEAPAACGSPRDAGRAQRDAGVARGRAAGGGVSCAREGSRDETALVVRLVAGAAVVAAAGCSTHFPTTARRSAGTSR
jgi:pimeloyl-ACP methyl ester carboxylesterase